MKADGAKNIIFRSDHCMWYFTIQSNAQFVCVLDLTGSCFSTQGTKDILKGDPNLEQRLEILHSAFYSLRGPGTNHPI